MNYDDIINYNYIGSKRKNKMTLYERSAQFSSFQALEGYTDTIKESERLTNGKIILDEEKISEINDKIRYIYDNNLKGEYIHFIKDIKKDGGKYIKTRGYIKNIDLINKRIIFKNNEIICLNNIIDVNICDN